MNNKFENGVVLIPAVEYAKLVAENTRADVDMNDYVECMLERTALKAKLAMYEEWLSDNSYHKKCFEEWKEKENGRD